MDINDKTKRLKVSTMYVILAIILIVPVVGLFLGIWRLLKDDAYGGLLFFTGFAGSLLFWSNVI